MFNETCYKISDFKRLILVIFASEMENLVFVSFVLTVCLGLCNAKCGQLFENKVSEEDKEWIVNAHNYLRSAISQGKVRGQPKGINLKELKWDDRLAEEAQKIANSCEFQHVTVNDDRFYVGQNLGWASSSIQQQGAGWADIIQTWFDEYKNFIYPDKSNGVVGHYTQLVWADTYLIGCGYASYRQDYTYEKLYVCNYGPGGNVNGQAPYMI